MSSMASIPQYHSDYTFCNELCDYFPPPFPGGNIGGAAAMWADQNLPFFFDSGAAILDDTVPPEVDVTSSFSTTPFPERFGVTDMAVPALPEFNMGLRGVAGNQSALELVGYHQDLCELGEECNGFVPDFRTVYPSNSNDNNNWGFQVSEAPAMEEPSMQVGKYSAEERKDRILRYLKKRNQRNFNKTIKYACRKTLADKRVRVRGRFARNNNELCEGELAVIKNKKKNNNNSPQDTDEFYNDETVKIKHDEEDWLQEAMASLMYLPNMYG